MCGVRRGSHKLCPQYLDETNKINHPEEYTKEESVDESISVNANGFLVTGIVLLIGKLFWDYIKEK